jgi:two-component system sensor histidine kinase TctE
MPAPRSLRSDLLTEMLLPMLVVVLLSGYLSYHIGVRFARQSYDRSLYETARSLAQQVRVADGRARIDLPRAAVEMLRADEADSVQFQVYSRRHGLLAGDADLAVPDFESEDKPLYFSRDFGDEATLYGVALQLRDIADDIVVVQVAETDRKRKDLAHDVMAAVLLPQTLLLLLSALAVRSGIQTGLKPLARLGEALHARSQSDLSPLPDDEVPAEVRPLSDAMNALLLRLDAALGVQRRFVADAAHQLRTPLAALKVQLERVLRESQSAQDGEALAQMLRSVERLARLSNQLLTLARAEPGAESQTRFGAVDLRALAFEVGAAYVPRALQQGADLGFAGGEAPVRVMGDALLLGELLRNLLDNALAYGRRDGRITLGVEEGERPALYVEDDGPGIPEAERELVFARFHRVPGTGAAGSGLGLAIVQEIARAHGAEVILETPPGGGARFRVLFPSMPAR